MPFSIMSPNKRQDCGITSLLVRSGIGKKSEESTTKKKKDKGKKRITDRE